jgi:hypothetical protein
MVGALEVGEPVKGWEGLRGLVGSLVWGCAPLWYGVALNGTDIPLW